MFGWRGAAIVFGLPAIAIAVAILLLIRERGTDRAAAVAGGSVRDAYRAIARDRDLRWLYLTSILGGGGRGLGVVNLFVLLYLTKVIGLGESLSGLMYGALIVFSVPMPLVAGWLSDRVGRKPLIIGVYLGGAIGFLVFLASGSSLIGLWAGIAMMGLFSFAESPQLQALLADIARPSIRDATFAAYFTLAFGVGSLWVAIYGAIIGLAGNTVGLQIVFVLMAVTFLLAALGTVPIRAEQRAPARMPRTRRRSQGGREPFDRDDPRVAIPARVTEADDRRLAEQDATLGADVELEVAAEPSDAGRPVGRLFTQPPCLGAPEDGRHALEVNRCRKREIELHQGCLVGVVTRRFGQRQSERPGGPPAQMPFGPFWPLRQG
jgi:hypothetical protein